MAPLTSIRFRQALRILVYVLASPPPGGVQAPVFPASMNPVLPSPIGPVPWAIARPDPRRLRAPLIPCMLSRRLTVYCPAVFPASSRFLGSKRAASSSPAAVFQLAVLCRRFPFPPLVVIEKRHRPKCISVSTSFLPCLGLLQMALLRFFPRTRRQSRPDAPCC